MCLAGYAFSGATLTGAWTQVSNVFRFAGRDFHALGHRAVNVFKASRRQDQQQIARAHGEPPREIDSGRRRPVFRRYRHRRLHLGKSVAEWGARGRAETQVFSGNWKAGFGSPLTENPKRAKESTDLFTWKKMVRIRSSIRKHRKEPTEPFWKGPAMLLQSSPSLGREGVRL